jgi:CHASE2 domain-containing sensor protein
LAVIAVAVALIPVRRLDLDLLLNFIRHDVQALEQAPANVIVITLGPEDRRELAADSGRRLAYPDCPVLPPAPDFADDPVSWRPLHACLLNALSRAGVKVVAFDLNFSREAPLESEAFLSAIDRARAEGLQVVVGHPGGARARLLTQPLYQRAYTGVTEAWAPPPGSWAPDTLKRVTLVRTLETADAGRREAVAGLSVQTYAVLHGGPARIAKGEIVYPPGLTGSALWVRYPRRAVPTVRYSAIVRHGAVDELRGKEAAIVGVVGAWAERLHDVHRLPMLPQQQLTGTGDLVPGVFVHAYALNQLQQRAGVFELPAMWVVAAALLVGALPVVLLNAVAQLRPDVYRRDQGRLPVTAMLARWPCVAFLGAGLVLSAAWLIERLGPALFRNGLVFPLLSIAVTAVVSGFVFAVPAFRCRRASRRLRSAIERVESMQSQSRWPALVRLPRSGIASFEQAMSIPAFSLESLCRLCESMHACFVEAEAAKTLFQRLPRRFFDAHDWLEPGGSAALDQLVAKADELKETFIGTELRRIRNLIHPDLPGHARALGHQALRRHVRTPDARLTAASALGAQLSLMSAASEYLETLAGWLMDEVRPEVA